MSTDRPPSLAARRRLLNAWVDDVTSAELIAKPDAGVVFTLNLDHLWLLQRDAEFAHAYAAADIVTADSRYVAWALGWLGRPVREKISGSDLVPMLCQHAAGIRIFLLGSTPVVADQARQRINHAAGREVVVGAHGPSMHFVDDPAEIDTVLHQVRASGADVLVVGLGSPKQEIWIAAHRHLLPQMRMVIGAGAAIDFEAGAVRRAPGWMRRIGLEWLYRAATRPGRYAGRYLRDTEFFWLLLKDASGHYRAPTFRPRR